MEPVVYSANDYIHFAGFRGSGTNQLYADLMDLKPGQILPLNLNDQKARGIQISSYHSIDFGTSNWSIGKTKDGQLYLAFADSWDFKGGEAPVLSTAAAAIDRIDYIVNTSTDVHAVLTKAYS